MVFCLCDSFFNVFKEREFESNVLNVIKFFFIFNGIMFFLVIIIFSEYFIFSFGKGSNLCIVSSKFFFYGCDYNRVECKLK